MAVTAAQFETMTPVAYSQARPGLRTGDILLFDSSDIGSQVVEHFTHSVWCHAAMVWRMGHPVDRAMVLESVDTFGVRALRLSNKINGCAASPKPYEGKLLVVRHADFPSDIPDAQQHAMMTFAVDRLGYPYSTKELLQIGIRIAAGMMGHDLPGEAGGGNSYICSEYVARCYSALGITLATDKEGFIAPGDRT